MKIKRDLAYVGRNKKEKHQEKVKICLKNNHTLLKNNKKEIEIHMYTMEIDKVILHFSR